MTCKKCGRTTEHGWLWQNIILDSAINGNSEGKLRSMSEIEYCKVCRLAVPIKTASETQP